MAPFFPRADAAVLASKREAAPHPPQVLQVLDHVNQDLPIRPWSATEEALYPAAIENFIPAPVPAKPEAVVDRYLRATLAPNESLRLGMLWYYTRGLQDDSEFLSGLQEKAYMAQDSTGWEYVVIGLLDLNYYIRLSTIGLPLSNLPRGETICAHTVIRPPGVSKNYTSVTMSQQTLKLTMTVTIERFLVTEPNGGLEISRESLCRVGWTSRLCRCTTASAK